MVILFVEHARLIYLKFQNQIIHCLKFFDLKKDI